MNKLVGFMAGNSGADFPMEKITVIAKGLLLVIIFAVAFFYFYRKYTRHEPALRRLFYWSSGILFFVIAAKYTIAHFYQGYIPDRLLFYAVASPKVTFALWFLVPLAVFTLFLYYREKIEALPAKKFLCCLWITFALVSLSVATMREGVYGVYERFTRTYWEYTGNLPLITSLPQFLHDYTTLGGKLAAHSVTHPPGYTVTLYLFSHYLGAGFLGLSVLVALLGGLSIFPMYYFLKRFFEEGSVRRGLQLFIFFPGVVMMSATSMETTFMFFVWLAVAVWYAGITGSFWKAFAGGGLIALALFQNYLFLLLAPLFLFFAAYAYRAQAEKKLVFARLLVSFAGFAAFFLLLYRFTGYSIAANFLVARHATTEWVKSNFETPWIYMTYALMNVLAFGIYLGIGNIMLFARRIKSFFSERRYLLLAGPAMVAFFVMVGIFQGEVERLWLFLTPLFVLPAAMAVDAYKGRAFSVIVALSFFQIIITQTLFYTYW